MRTIVIARTSVEAIHRWKLCPIEEVSYLRNYHRHVFNVIAKISVDHTNRDVEFIQLSHKIKSFLTDQFFDNNYSCLFFDDRSCEMIAQLLVEKFNLLECEVNEDGEGGAIVSNI